MKTFDQGSGSNLQARGQRLLQLLGLLLVRDLQGVEEARASDLEFESRIWSIVTHDNSSNSDDIP